MDCVRINSLSRAFGPASLLLSTLIAGCAGEDAGSRAAAATVFEGARIIAGDGQVIENGAFAVENGRFSAVGAPGSVDLPEGGDRIDLSGKTVMPAFVNAHMHLPTTRQELSIALRHNAYYGAAAVVSLGSDSGEAPFEVRDAEVQGAARSLTAGRGITRPEPGRSEVPHWINTVEEARQAVRELTDPRVDIVKIWVDDRGGQYEKLTPELYGAVIDEAHQHGLQVTAHIFNLEDAKGLLRAGIDAFAHGVRDQDVDDEFLQLIAERPEVYYVPNLPNRGVATDLGWLSTFPPDELAELQAAAVDRPEVQEAYGIQARNLARVNEAGVRIAFGTDGGSPWAAHVEMEDMVAAGMTPAEVIVAATSTSAALMGLDDLGSIAAGKSADFIILDANPLEDITNTRQISGVYLSGSELDRDRIRERLRAGAQ